MFHLPFVCVFKKSDATYVARQRRDRDGRPTPDVHWPVAGCSKLSSSYTTAWCSVGEDDHSLRIIRKLTPVRSRSAHETSVAIKRVASARHCRCSRLCCCHATNLINAKTWTRSPLRRWPPQKYIHKHGLTTSARGRPAVLALQLLFFAGGIKKCACYTTRQSRKLFYPYTWSSN